MTEVVVFAEEVGQATQDKNSILRRGAGVLQLNLFKTEVENIKAGGGMQKRNETARK